MASGETWWRIAPALRERGWGAAAVDLPGHGGRPAPAGPLTLDALAAGIGAADVLIGHSLGALVALRAAAARPANLRALVLEEPPGGDGIDRAALADGIEADVAQARRNPAPLLARERRDNPRWADGDVERSVRAMALTDAATVAPGIRKTLRWDLPTLLAAAPVPALVLAAPERSGTYPHDPGTALRGTDRARVRAMGPPARFVELPGGHCLHRDDPAAWLAAVEPFLVTAAAAAG